MGREDESNWMFHNKTAPPMPDEIDVLPAPEALSDALLQRCSVDAGDTTSPTGYCVRLGNEGE